MNYDALIKAFKIFNKYENTGSLRTGYYEIWAGPKPENVSSEDTAKLKELGWNNYGEGVFHYFV